jgi:hypothetical protein
MSAAKAAQLEVALELGKRLMIGPLSRPLVFKWQGGSLPLPAPVQKPQEGGLLLAPARRKEAASRKEIRERATAVILVPTHRSGDASPSREDMAITDKLENTGEGVAVRVLDHVIAGDGAYANMLEKRY